MSFAAQAYTTLKRNILENHLPPGYRALEQELATELGMSRTPVREALIRLEREGLIELIPRRGMRVVPLSPTDMREIYEVVTGLETTALDLMAEMDPASIDWALLEENLQAMEDALVRDDLDSWAEADAAYHQTLLVLCENRRLADLGAQLSDQAHRARMITLRLRPRPTRSNSEHRQVLEALKQGEWEKARRLHRRHRIRTAELLLEILEYYRLSHL
jgi:DNA-binding GntR family transcriptional regulator